MKTVACPHCGAAVQFVPQNKWRPFCSERCKMVDLGAWGSERYSVPEPEGQDPSSTPPES